MASGSQSSHVFPFVIGLTDGILTALTFAAAKVVRSPDPLTLGLALRIAAASSLSGMFVFFAAERQLSLRAGGRLASTRLGRAILLETLLGAALSSSCNFVGALVPLLAGALVPQRSWLALAVGIAVLGALGLAAGRASHGRPLLWAAALMSAGAALSAVGLELRIV